MLLLGVDPLNDVKVLLSTTIAVSRVAALAVADNAPVAASATADARAMAERVLKRVFICSPL